MAYCGCYPGDAFPSSITWMILEMKYQYDQSNGHVRGTALLLLLLLLLLLWRRCWCEGGGVMR